MEKKMKVLYVASTQNKAHNCFDGEVIKSELIKEILQKHFDVTLINLTEHKLLKTIKLLFILMFKRFDRYVISKSSGGANLVLSFFRFFRVKKEKISYFAIGASLPKILDKKKSSVKNFKHTNSIIVETDSLKESLLKYNFNNIEVLHNFKKQYDLDIEKKQYPMEVLKLCFLSRVIPEKGVLELMRAVRDINKEKVRFKLDIYGKYYDDGFYKEIKNMEDNNMKYLGITSLNSKEDYIKLEDYDLHVFPTLFITEGVPGSIIDFFLLGIPTVSPKYGNYQETINDDIAFLYERDNSEALKDTLMYIYKNQSEIEKKSVAISKIVYKFSEGYFEKELLRIMGGNDNGSK